MDCQGSDEVHFKGHFFLHIVVARHAPNPFQTCNMAWPSTSLSKCVFYLFSFSGKYIHPLKTRQEKKAAVVKAGSLGSEDGGLLGHVVQK